MRKLALLASLLLATLLSSSFAHARRRVVVEEDDEPEPANKLTVGVFPIELLGPFFEAGVEARLPSNFSGALIGGYGTPRLAGDLHGKKFFEVAGQFRYYVGGSFDGGIHVGAEAMYLGGPKTEDATAVGATFSAGAFVGFKYVLRAGFTIDSQIGLRGLIARQKVENVETRGKDAQLLGRFLVGWTF